MLASTWVLSILILEFKTISPTMHLPFILAVLAFASLNHAYPKADISAPQTGSITYEDLKFRDEYGGKLRNYEVKIENINKNVQHEIIFNDGGIEAKKELGKSVRAGEGIWEKWSFQAEPSNENPESAIHRFLVAMGDEDAPEEDTTDTLGTTNKDATANSTPGDPTPDQSTPGTPKKATAVNFDAVDKELVKAVKKMTKQTEVTAVAGEVKAPWKDGLQKWKPGVEAH